VNLFIFLSEISDFKQKAERGNLEDVMARMELEEVWERADRRVTPWLFYPGLKAARWLNRQMWRKRLRVIEQRRPWLSKLKQKTLE
jgi:hypothetical protein